MKKQFLLVSLIILSQANASWDLAAPTVAAGALALGAAGVKWFTTPDKTELSLEDLNLRTIRQATDVQVQPEVVTDVKAYMAKSTSSTAFFQKAGGKQVYTISRDVALNEGDSDVAIAVGGFLNNIAYIDCANGGHFGYLLLKSGTTDLPCVTFESNDTRPRYSFGGPQDLANLDLVLNAIRAKKPDVKMHLIGSCKGSTVILNYLAQKAANNQGEALTNIASVVLESPPASLGHTTKGRPLSSLHTYLYRAVFPNYDHNAPTILDATAFPQNIPIFFGGIRDDKSAPYDDIVAMKQILERLGNTNVSLFTREESDANVSHGRLPRDPEFQKAARAFINLYSKKSE